MVEAEALTVGEADSMAAVVVVFMEAEAGARIAVAAGMAAELDVRMAAGCNAAEGEASAGIRRADTADMGERDMAEEGSVAGLALRAERSAAMRRDFPMRDRR